MGALVALLPNESSEIRLAVLEVLDRCSGGTIAKPALARVIARLARLDESAMVRSQATRTLARSEVGDAIMSERRIGGSPLMQNQPTPMRPTLAQIEDAASLSPNASPTISPNASPLRAATRTDRTPVEYALIELGKMEA